MLSTLSDQIGNFVSQSKAYLPMWLTCMAALWGFNIFNWIIGKPFNRLGIRPRKLLGLPGIFISPFLHSGFNHLFLNTIPLFILGLFILPDGLDNFVITNVFTMFVGGFAVWCIGRPGVHIGASAVISGYFGYVLISAFQAPTLTSIALCVLALYYFGGILFSLFPTEDDISWEGHLTGFLAGMAARYFLPAIDSYLLLPNSIQ